MMKTALSLIVLAGAGAAAAASALAQAPVTTGDAERIKRIIVYGTDPCPRGAEGEIVVCARRPGSDRYRIPEEFRDDVTAGDPASTSWAVQAQSLEYVGRTGIESCSTIGPAGFTGCWAQLMRTAREERRAALQQPR